MALRASGGAPNSTGRRIVAGCAILDPQRNQPKAVPKYQQIEYLNRRWPTRALAFSCSIEREPSLSSRVTSRLQRRLGQQGNNAKARQVRKVHHSTFHASVYRIQPSNRGAVAVVTGRSTPSGHRHSHKLRTSCEGKGCKSEVLKSVSRVVDMISMF